MYDNKFKKLDVEIYKNAKLQLYPDGKHKLTIATRPIFKEEGGWESTEEKSLYQNLKI